MCLEQICLERIQTAYTVVRPLRAAFVACCDLQRAQFKPDFAQKGVQAVCRNVQLPDATWGYAQMPYRALVSFSKQQAGKNFRHLRCSYLGDEAVAMSFPLPPKPRRRLADFDVEQEVRLCLKFIFVPRFGAESSEGHWRWLPSFGARGTGESHRQEVRSEGFELKTKGPLT